MVVRRRAVLARRAVLTISSVAAILLALLPQARPVQAATLVVTTTIDAPHSAPISSNCTSTLPGNPCTLRAAIQTVNFLGGGPHTINLAAAGVYQLTVAGTREDDAATGDLDVNGVSLTIVNASGGTVAIDGNRADRVFDIGPRQNANFTLIGVTVQNGFVQNLPVDPSPETTQDVGGAIRRQGLTSSIALNFVTLTGNFVANRGGAIGMPPAGQFLRGGTGHLALNNVICTNNSAGTEGACVFTNINASINNSTIADNTVFGTTGVERGGGIANSGGTLEMTNTTLSRNAIPGGSGGGWANRGDPTTNPPTFGTVRMTNVTMNGNSAAVGGAIANNALAELAFVTIANNQGGGMSIQPPGAPFPISGGGGIGSGGFPQTRTTVRTTILANNPGGNCLVLGPGLVSQGDNISSDATCPFNALGDRNNTNPLIGPLANNGGPTQTHDLQPGSPAIDGVLNNPCPPPSTDQRGAPRPQGARCDIGAVEQGAVPPAAPVFIPSLIAIPTATPAVTPVTPTSIVVPNNVAQITASLRPDGQLGVPCASTVGQTCQIQGGVTGTARVTGSMAVNVTVPAGVIPAGAVANVFFSTTAGIENIPCPAAVAGTPTTCVGTLVGNALQGSTVRVFAGGTQVATGTVTGPGAVANLPPPPPIILPPPPPPVIPMPPAATGGMAQPYLDDGRSLAAQTSAAIGPPAPAAAPPPPAPPPPPTATLVPTATPTATATPRTAPTPSAAPASVPPVSERSTAPTSSAETRAPEAAVSTETPLQTAEAAPSTSGSGVPAPAGATGGASAPEEGPLSRPPGSSDDGASMGAPGALLAPTAE